MAGRRVVVVGVGTGVGKTHVAEALLRRLVAEGEDAVGLKPVESGWAPATSDARRLAVAAGRGAEPRYALVDPVSPHLAARREGVRITLEAVAAWVDSHVGGWQVVEAAGGVATPLAPGLTNAELVGRLAAGGVVLAAVDRLGVLHEVGAAVAVLGELARRRTVVALSAPEVADASTGTNGAELVELGLVPAVVGFPRARVMDAGTVAAARALHNALVDCFTRN
jgi:dethiobiotin synthetase